MAKKWLTGEARFWAANIYLAGQIADCADYLIRHLKGYPGEFDAKRTRAKISGYSKANEKKWRQILMDIRDGFRLYEKCDGDFHEWKGGKAPPNEPFEKMMERLNNPKSPYKVILNKAKLKKFQRAMELFGKYYEHLWD